MNYFKYFWDFSSNILRINLISNSDPSVITWDRSAEKYPDHFLDQLSIKNPIKTRQFDFPLFGSISRIFAFCRFQFGRLISVYDWPRAFSRSEVWRKMRRAWGLVVISKHAYVGMISQSQKSTTHSQKALNWPPPRLRDFASRNRFNHRIV